MKKFMFAAIAAMVPWLQMHLQIQQKLALLSSHRLPLRILSNRRIPRRRQLSSRRLQRLSSRQMLNKKSQESSIEFYLQTTY